MNRLFAVSRMTMLLSTAVAWLDIACNERSLFAEEPKPRNASSAPADREATKINGVEQLGKEGATTLNLRSLRPGRFELKVSPGWSGTISLTGDNDDGPSEWNLRSCTNIGMKEEAETIGHQSETAERMFQCDSPVLEVSCIEDELAYLHARRQGTATLQFAVLYFGEPSRERDERLKHLAKLSEAEIFAAAETGICEITVIVEANTSEIDKAIKSAAPQSKVKVIEIKDAAMLSGTVPAEADIALLLEVAEQFYPKIINRVKVAGLTAAEVRDRADTNSNPVHQAAAQSQPAPLAKSEDAPRNERREGKSPRLSARNVEGLRDEVRGLREDVRRLNELLEKRLATKAVDPPLVESKTEHTDESPNTVIKAGMLFFTATWCGPCQQMVPGIERLKREDLPIQTVDIDRLPSLAKQYHVLSIPCCVFVANGTEVDRITGLHSEQGLRSRLKPLAAKNHPKPKVDTESELSLSLAERPLPPITMQVGQRSELLFARRIRAVEKESDATLSLIRVAGNAVMVQGKVAGVTVLHVSLDESPDVLDVIVHVTASESQAAPPRVVTFDGTKAMPPSVIVQVGSSVEVGFDDWLTRVDGFDPQLVNVTATDKVRLKLEGVFEGKTSLKVTKRNGEAAFEVTVVPTPDQAAARLPVVTHRIAGTETLSRLVTLIEGTDRRMKTQQPTPRISIGDAQVVDVIQESPTSQRLRGLKPGMTTITFWLAGASEPEPVVVTIRVLPRVVEIDPREAKTLGKYKVDANPNADPNTLVVKTYSVADLVVPVSLVTGESKPPRAGDWLKLVDRITESVDPDSWDENGGPGSIRHYETTLSLVIRARPDTHQRIEKLLTKMRDAQDVLVVLETQFLQIEDSSFFEQAGPKITLDEKTLAAKLDERDAAKFVKAVLAHEECALLTAPKLTLTSGQIAEVKTDVRGVDAKVSAFHLHVRGVVTPDRTGVRLNITVNPQYVPNDLLSHSHRVADGGYLLFDMTDEFHRYQSEKPKGRMLVLIRARIIIQKEAELIGVPAVVDPKSDDNAPLKVTLFGIPLEAKPKHAVVEPKPDGNVTLTVGSRKIIQEEEELLGLPKNEEPPR